VGKCLSAKGYLMLAARREGSKPPVLGLSRSLLIFFERRLVIGS